ncbi:uncharacterized protein LOC143152718 [Ptiloglossa arizonensis]|uniref:uncharacterized protein LOC143152718 n=1 Tax=Ptiloglossa arizonensis TaxID=3350558 RepID=UPI003F9F92C0
MNVDKSPKITLSSLTKVNVDVSRDEKSRSTRWTRFQDVEVGCNEKGRRMLRGRNTLGRIHSRRSLKEVNFFGLVSLPSGFFGVSCQTVFRGYFVPVTKVTRKLTKMQDVVAATIHFLSTSNFRARLQSFFQGVFIIVTARY